MEYSPNIAMMSGEDNRVQVEKTNTVGHRLAVKGRKFEGD